MKPENTNVDVRVLSDGADGPVSQANTSTAAAIAANLNATDQQVAQDPARPGGPDRRPGGGERPGRRGRSRVEADRAAEHERRRPGAEPR